MMGQTASQDQLFYAFNLSDHVPRDHLLRGIDRFLDIGELRQHLAPFYSHTGRPSIDPELELPPFHGHLIVLAEGVQSIQTTHTQDAVFGAVS